MANLVKTALNMKCKEMSGKTDRISTCALQYLMSVFSENCVSFGLLFSEYFQYSVNSHCHKKVFQNTILQNLSKSVLWERISFFFQDFNIEENNRKAQEKENLSAAISVVS